MTSKLKYFGISVMIALTVYILYMPYETSAAMADQAGPVLSNNWWEALNWMKNNTEECAVVATYWDPGHFITGIGERAVVFDGASQNKKRTIEVEGELTQEEIGDIAVIDNYNSWTEQRDGVTYTIIETARIQDIGTTLFTDNETFAVDILRKYLMPGCNNTMYYIASGDLISKSQWWTYFSTWNPENHTGTKYYYFPLTRTVKQPVISENAIAHVYPMSQDSSFVVYEKNDTLTLLYQQSGDLLSVRSFFYYVGNMAYQQENDEAEIEGLVWLSPDMTMLVYVPDELKNSVFTNMYLFNGMGLEKFELVKNFGGEVKIFRVIFD